MKVKFGSKSALSLNAGSGSALKRLLISNTEKLLWPILKQFAVVVLDFVRVQGDADQPLPRLHERPGGAIQPDHGGYGPVQGSQPHRVSGSRRQQQ